ncbi:MAG: Alkaline serine exoprotease A precursor [uncultured Lysobacter sp.]|uniref:Alkaline serine exoprotease A n=1 Tax=uncultured Lysobacter sp. TaxID=271060 RepID=A0A6J4LN25_9GAMM|nr:MAG: Alkaline serine exoprotease A precursor [uncultured Lysobacter sp.]
MSAASGKVPATLHALAAATLLVLAPIGTADAADFRVSARPVEGQYIVVLKDDAASLASERSNRPQVASVASEMARTHRANLVRSYNRVLRGFVVKASDEALARLLADKRVAYVEEDGLVQASATQSNATWGLDRTDQRDLPLSGTYTYDTTASTVHAYIIDTGVRASHADFGGRVSGGYTAISDGRGTNDCNGHGTHVAGTVGGATWGIAKGVQLHPIRVLDCNGSGTNSGVIAGVDWVTSNHVKPAVANMSLGGGASSALDTAVNNSINAGVTYAVAAGNDNADACNYSPARVGAALTAGSSTSSDARSSFSNFGSCIDLFAPGSSIMSAWYTGDTATNTISGTSMASPHIAGVAALYLATNPGATPSQVNTALINAATPNKITDPKASPNRLLYSFFDGGGGGGGGGGTTLTNGVAVTGLAASTGNSLVYTMTVPAGASNLKFVISGGTGDADLYVKFGSQPTDTSYDCRPYLSGNAETCSFATPAAGTWYVRVKAYSSFSGLSLTGSYGTSSGGTQTYTNGTDLAIPDRGTVESPIAVSGRTGSAPSDAKVAVDIRHTYRGDLTIDLVAPDGSTYRLKNSSSSDSADNVQATYTVNLSTEALNGTWKLRVADVYSGDTGYINSWSVTF